MAKGKKTGGRKKGTPNVITGDLRGLIMGALDAVGGQAYLQEQALNNPAAFISLLGKVVPKDVNLKTEGGLHLSISLSNGN